MKLKLNISVDGPAGAGKSTVAKMLAEELNLLYVDTGSMYRVITYKALQMKIDLTNEKILGEITANTKLNFIHGLDGDKIFVDGQNITQEIRSPEVNKKVSFVAKVSAVRKNLVRLQQEIAADGGVVMDGRDIGTKVLPHAKFKFFLTASIEERVCRRQKDLEKQGYTVKSEELIKEIASRDEMDQNREIDPLIPAKDAIIIDTTGMNIPEVITKMKNYINDCK